MGERSKRHLNPDAKLKAESAKRFPRDTLIKLRSSKVPSKDSNPSFFKTPEFIRKQQQRLERESNACNARELRGVTRERESGCVCVVVSVFVSNEK